MKKVKCISIRDSLPNQLVVGRMYYMDESTKYTDYDGDTYVMIYADRYKDNKIGNMKINHFCSYEESASIDARN